MTISTNWQNHDLTPDATTGNSLQTPLMIDDSLTRADGETVIAADLPAAIAPTDAPLILIVDDEKPVRAMVRQVLEADGYRVIEACNGKQALALYCQFKPELVLLDWRMPVMDGLTCYQELMRLVPVHPVPVIVLTALDDEAVVEQAFTIGATDIFTKPIHQALLRHRVRHLLAEQQKVKHILLVNQPLHPIDHAIAPDAEQQLLDMQTRIIQLHQALECETALKQITEQIHLSLDENQILQTAVEELTRRLNAHSCHAAIYDLEKQRSHILKEYSAAIASNHATQVQIDDYPNMAGPLAAGDFPCCCLKPPAEKGMVIFATPLVHEKITIGDLWLFGPAGRMLDELEARLVQQVAHQCAIAVWQARLYQKAQVQIAELEKLHQAKDDFLSTVSHELRSPLANIRLSIQMLEHALHQQQLNKDPQATNWQRIFIYLQILHDECEDEINLINDLLDLQRLETGHHPLHLDTINLHEWIAAIIATFAERVKERQQNLVLNIAPELVTVHSDHASLKRILVELLNNACKYAPPESTITLTAAVVEIQATLPPKAHPLRSDPVLRHGEATGAVADTTGPQGHRSLPSTCLQITVTNTGSEIPASEQTRIFDKFYRIPNGDPWKQGGSGLGLALVKRLVEHLGGKINVHSSTNQTRFAIELPN